MRERVKSYKVFKVLCGYFKIVISCLMICLLVFSLNSCKRKELISEDNKIIEVNVVKCNYKAPVYNQFYIDGILHINEVSSAEYNVYVMYEGKGYIVNDKKTYYEYINKIGENADAVLTTKKYSDGGTTVSILGLRLSKY